MADTDPQTGVDWSLVAKIATPILSAIVSVVVDRYFGKRPKLVYSLLHANAVRVAPAGGASFDVHVHTLLVSNTGRSPATNVRIGHTNLPPNISVYPDTARHLEQLDGGSTDLVIDRLLPRETLQVHYLYYAPLTWRDIHSHIKCDEGLGVNTPIQPTRQFPAWARRTAWTLAIIGLVATAYALFELSIVAISAFQR